MKRYFNVFDWALVRVSWASDGYWEITDAKGRKHRFLIRIGTVKATDGLKCFNVTLGPFMIDAGLINHETK